MLRSVTVFAQTMRPLPRRGQCWCVSAKLLYKDDVTQLNYQPKHFMPLAIKNSSNSFSNFCCFGVSECEECPMGVVETDYHSVRVSIETGKHKKVCAHKTSDLAPQSSQSPNELKSKGNPKTNELCCANEGERISGGGEKGEFDEGALAGREAAVLLDKRDRVLFAMDVMEDLPAKKASTATEGGGKQRALS